MYQINETSSRVILTQHEGWAGRSADERVSIEESRLARSEEGIRYRCTLRTQGHLYFMDDKDIMSKGKGWGRKNTHCAQVGVASSLGWQSSIGARIDIPKKQVGSADADVDEKRRSKKEISA
jgi:hypothetical protein